MLACDHASNALPVALGQLGLGSVELAQHIAWDIGAAQVTRLLAAQLDAPVQYSFRLGDELLPVNPLIGKTLRHGDNPVLNWMSLIA